MPQDSIQVNLPDSRVTEVLGAALAHSLPALSAGAVLYLQGELGSGKTTCARSLLHALGVTATVRSPTYTLVDTYSTSALDLVHVDLYRLRSSAEVEELGLRDLTGPRALMLIEWPEQGGSAVPPADLDVQLRYAGESREASLRAGSEVGLVWLGKLGLDRSLMPYVSNLT